MTAKITMLRSFLNNNNKHKHQTKASLDFERGCSVCSLTRLHHSVTGKDCWQVTDDVSLMLMTNMMRSTLPLLAVGGLSLALPGKTNQTLDRQG